MDKQQIERLVDAAIMEGIIETECKECGMTIQCEADATNAWCGNCHKKVRVRNLLHELGMI